MKILICEDDLLLGTRMARFLGQQGYEILLCSSLEDVYDCLYAGADLFLLDVHIGQDSTFGLCKLVHHTIGVPVLLLSADLQETSMLQGYDSQAAEYIEKPVSPAVLLAKIRAVLKHNKIVSVISAGDYTLDLDENLLKTGNESWPLSSVECRLLRKLMQASPHLVSKEVLKNGVSPDGSDATLRSRISELRRHIPGQFHIRSVRELGYRLVIGEER